jgi:hypothetical protein
MRLCGRGSAAAPSWVGLIAALAVSIFASGCSLLPRPSEEALPIVRGPLPSRTQHPMALTYLAMRPRRAAIQPVDRIGVEFQSVYTSIFERTSNSGEQVRFDGELWRNSLRVRKGISSEMDIEIEVAALYTTSGFLDDFIKDYHEFLHLPQGGRKKVSDDQYAMVLRKDGQTIYDLEEDRAGFGDIPVILTRRLRAEDEDGPAVAGRVGIELPTGSDNRGNGNGKLDFGGGVLAERSYGRWTLTGALDYIVTGRPDSFDGSGVDAENIVQVQSGCEYRWSNVTSCLVQVFWTTPMVDDFNQPEIDESIVDLGLGIVRDIGGGGRFTFSFHEDLVAATGPDFSVLVGIGWGF